MYQNSESETLGEPGQASVMEHFSKIVKGYSCFLKLKLFSQYQPFIFSIFFNKSLLFTPEVFIL